MLLLVSVLFARQKFTVNPVNTVQYVQYKRPPGCYQDPDSGFLIHKIQKSTCKSDGEEGGEVV
jgi:hypothetical protein